LLIYIATLQRKIEYKNEGLISSKLSRRLARLSALLELVDDEFQEILNKEISELIFTKNTALI
jgi:ppGpp synthetase/RelA/SpoT-type nucleotidyltranferase